MLRESKAATPGRGWRGIVRQPKGAVSLAIVCFLGVTALFGPIIFGGDPNATSIEVFDPPFGGSLLGTDELGRDVALQLIHGLRSSLLIGLGAAGGAALIGIAIGSIAGFFGGWMDHLVMRIAEVFQIMPAFIFAAVMIAMVGPGLSRVVVVIALLTWPDIARLMRSEVVRVRNLEFVDAAQAIGLGSGRIMFREIIPNSLGPAAALAALVIGQAILLEASLSFLGLASPAQVSWGRMLNSGQRFIYQAWWLTVFPGIAVMVTVLSFNLLGDAVGRVLDPRHAR